ncbi:helix-turn-helix domain-containing protein [Streptomyces sp. NPDC048192]|uniref:helix-turn-helix domain-containing protein n=1 Tax=Streptomyces sp. NPDC048192 TaxID=3365510 RepID=UPI00372284EB
MCRPERPLTTSNKALRELQEWLREQRKRTRQGYRALSVRAGCHATTLQRAASGETVPKLQTVLNYARACDAPPEEARLLWKRARYEETRLARAGRGRPAPRPAFIRDFVDLGAALVELYEKAGSPPLRTMEQRAGGYGALPRSSAHRIVNKQAMPHGLRQFQAYLRACEVPEAEWPDWEAAWTRAWRHEKHDDFVALGITADSAVVGTAAADAWDMLQGTAGRLFRDHPGYLQDRAISNLDPLVAASDGTRRTASLVYEPLSESRRKAVPMARSERVQQVRGRVRRIGRAPHERFPDRSVQGQLPFPIGEAEVETGALF